MNCVNEKLLQMYESEKNNVEEFKQKCIDVIGTVNEKTAFGYQLACATDMYLNTPIKLLHIGQENNGWNGDEITQDSIEGTIKFHKEDLYKKSPFLQYGKKISQKLNGNYSLEHISWTNILKLFVNEKGRTSEIRQTHSELYIDYFKNTKTLMREINLLKPDIVVFACGYSYDKFIKTIFEGVRINKACDDLNISQLARLEHEWLPKNTFRTYHSGYFHGKYNPKEKIINKIVELSLSYA